MNLNDSKKLKLRTIKKEKKNHEEIHFETTRNIRSNF